MRILIAEDDFTSRMLLAGVLTKGGHEVTETVDGVDACRVMLLPDAPGLAIIDWMMPGLDGLEVVRRIRALKTDRPPYIILLTTRSGKPDIATGLNTGADDYLVKPFDAGELHARIEVGRRMVEMQDSLAARIGELRQALEQIKTLRGILPICMHCKKIRDDRGYWNQVETYIRDHTDAEFSHGICPECKVRLYPEFAQGDAGDGKKNS
jgi:sigma-B regulation protein RsbU (phosphoserine phosphatase)